MIGQRKIIAIVPARGGSKGLPGKNIMELCGKPLLVWTIEKALQSRVVDAVVVSTDSEAIAQVARAAGAAVPFMRPAQLATDAAPTMAVVEHALGQIGAAAGESFDYVALLEPTSPLRADTDIDNVLLRLDGSSDRFDSIVTVGELREHPSLAVKLIGDEIQPYCPGLKVATRRQDNEPAYFPYGAVYAAKTAALLAEQTFFTKRCTYYRIQRYQNHEIDHINDFRAVEAVMRAEWKVT